MTATPLRLFVPAAIVGIVVAGAAVHAQSMRTIQDSTRPAPLIIAVLADNFTADEVAEFNEAVDNLFTYGLFAVDPFIQNRAAFRVVSVFHPKASPQTPSRYGFSMATDPASNCSVSWAADTDSKVFADQSTVPDADYAVVIGNYNYTFGCRNANWAYIPRGSVGHPIIEHEIAHLVFGLLDEFSLAKNLKTTYPTPPVRPNVNCSTNVKNPHWMNNANFPKAGILSQCDLFGEGIVHAYGECKMGTHGRGFCPVCRRILTAEMGCVLGNKECGEGGQPGPPAPVNLRMRGLMLAPAAQPSPAADRPVLRLLLRVSSQPGAGASVISAVDSKGRGVTRDRRVGDFVYEVTDGGKTLAVGVVPGNPFEARSYRGGITEHGANTQPASSILVTVPGESRDTVRAAGRNVTITFYRVSPDVGDLRINPGFMEKFRGGPLLQQHAQVTSQQLREGLAAAK